MIFEALIASHEISIILDGHRLRPDLIDAQLPVPLLREHAGQPVGSVYRLSNIGGHLIAIAETDCPDAYTHVSPGLRLLNGRMKLLELSLVQESKSPHTKIQRRYNSDPHRDYQRSLAEGHDLLILYFNTLQQLLRNIHGQHSHS